MNQDFVTHHEEAVKWNYMTPHGYEALKQEAKKLDAENSPEATERLTEIEGYLKKACVIDPSKRINTNTIGFGATVTFIQNDQKSTVTIVGCDEADSDQNKISWYSELTSSLRYSRNNKEIQILDVEYPSKSKNPKEYQRSDFSFIGYEDGVFSFHANDSDKIIILDFLRDISEQLYNRFINIFEDHDKTLYHFIDHLHDQVNIEDGILKLHEQEFWYTLPYFRMVHDDFELKTVIPKEIVEAIYMALWEAEEVIFEQLDKNGITLELKETSDELVEFHATDRDIYNIAQCLRYIRDADLRYYQHFLDVDLLTELIRKIEDKKIENGVLKLSYWDEFHNIYRMYQIQKDSVGNRYDGKGYRSGIFKETLKRLAPASKLKGE